MQSNPNVFSMPLLFSKAILLWAMSSFPPDAGLSQPKSEEKIAERFPRLESSYGFPFHPVLFIKEQFLLAFRHPNLPNRFKKIRLSRLHWGFSPLLVRNSRLVRSGYFFIHFPIGIATGSTSDSHPLSVNARPIWIKIYLTLYLSDPHPLSVNLAFKLIFSQHMFIICSFAPPFVDFLPSKKTDESRRRWGRTASAFLTAQVQVKNSTWRSQLWSLFVVDRYVFCPSFQRHLSEKLQFLFSSVAILNNSNQAASFRVHFSFWVSQPGWVI